ncbi:MAG: TonB-dependent receptor plug domain-containing protein [Bacteroidota bacterium]
MRALLLSFLMLSLAGCWSSRPAVGNSTDRDSNTVRRADMDGRDIQRVEEMLRGQIAGVSVRQGANGLIIRIRGTSDVNVPGTSGNDPLFVIDGLPIELGADGALDGINPRDVESIRVLKNASDTAMYGSRGANGVILITTMRPPPPAEPDDEDGASR